MVALGHLTPEVADLLDMLRCFRSFCYDLQSQIVGKQDDDMHNLATLRIRVHVGNKCAIDFQRINGKALQPTQGGISRAEIVDADANTQGFELGQGGPGSLLVCHGCGLSNFHPQAGGRKTRLFQKKSNLFREFELSELFRGEVDTDKQRRIRGKLRMPDAKLPERLLHKSMVDGQDQAGLLRDRNEVHGLHHAVWTLPPAEGLESNNLFRVEGDDGLVVDQKFAELESFAEVGLERKAFDGRGVHGGVKQLTASLSGAFGSVHGNFGVPQKVFRFGAGRGAQGDADARCNHDLLPVDDEGGSPFRLNAFGDAYRVAGVSNVVQKNGKFVATQSGDRVIRRKRLLELGQAGAGNGIHPA